MSIFDPQLKLIKYHFYEKGPPSKNWMPGLRWVLAFLDQVQDIENLIVLWVTEVLNLKIHERMIHLLDSSRYDNQFCGGGASEAPARA